MKCGKFFPHYYYLILKIEKKIYLVINQLLENFDFENIVKT